MPAFLKRLFGRRAARGLTREAIETLPPRKLCYRTLYSLPDAAEANAAQRDFVCMFLLDGDVRNGGFTQYFYNEGEQWPSAAEAFARAGAADLTEVVRAAGACFEQRRERLEACWDGTAKGFSNSYREGGLARFDEAYFDRADKTRFYDLLARFVRERAEAFITE